MEPKRHRPISWTCILWSAIILLSIVFPVNTMAFAQSSGSPEQLASQLKEVIAAQKIGDSATLDKLTQINNTLKAQGLNIAIEAIQFLTLGKGRPDIRVHQEGMRWVPGDVRRNAQGDNITFFDYFTVDPSLLPPGVSSVQAQGAVDGAMYTWANDKSLQNLAIVSLPGYGFGFYGLGDIMHYGWTSLGSPEIGAITAIYVFTYPNTIDPSDINGDHYLDTAFCLTLYNSDISWGINVPLPSIDIQSVALHEAGHGLGIGHFGPPPIGVMNPIYTGMKQTLFPIDSAGMSILYGSWPNR